MADVGLRWFLNRLRSEGELVEVDQPVSPVHELAAHVDAGERGENKAFLFRTVKGHDIPVAAGLYGSTKRHLLGLCMGDMSEFAEKLEQAIARPVAPERLGGAHASCQEVRFTPDMGLERLPIPTHFAGDGGPYITSGVVILHDGNRGNAGVYRIQVHGSRELTVMTNRFHDGHRIVADALGAGRTVDVAIAIGVDPALFIAAFWPVGPHADELGVAGALLGRPLGVAPALTVDLDVPAHAEIVIEGQIRSHRTRFEGPFADITGQVTSAGQQPVVEVSAITTRRDPIYHTVLGFNSREHFKSRNNDFWHDYQAAGRTRVRGLDLGTAYDVHFPPAGRNFHAVASLRKLDDRMPRRLMEGLFGAYGYLKRVVVVDDDIDIRDPAQVEWAQATRVGRPGQITIGQGLGSRIDASRDPSDDRVVKVGIDATVPLAQRNEVIRPGLSESGFRDEDS